VRGEGGLPFVFDSRADAEREIVALMIDRLNEFLNGTRQFEEAITTEEYVVEVDVLQDGRISTEGGSTFGKE
jgi:hypothetical protein